MECTICNYKTAIKCNYQNHLLSARHIKKEAEVDDGIKETTEQCINRLIKETKDLREINKQNEEFIINKYQKQINNLNITIEQLKLKPEKNIPKNDISSTFNLENNVFIKQPSMDFRFL
jgi:hypothetical protein